ncbi:LysR family transcriptional regulator [Scopulibacillus cellulosilyticus]|uniref:LysR family transcriptional regulator n=1 Tax=Scopulibacillus cellulosilyticus TaxID=2665665 RepID=A0ABW2Q6I1_9BACL
MNLDSLKMFCLVVENKSISIAARKFFVSQPAVTKQIKALEEYYGMLLFERSGGNLHITEAGKLLYPYAKAILEDHERAKERLANYKGNQHTPICVGATLTIGEYLLPKLLGRFKQRNPDINLKLQVANTQDILESLQEHHIDLALVEGKVDNPSLMVEKFADDELVLICSEHHKWSRRKEINSDELTGEPMIWRENGSGTRMIIENALNQKGLMDNMDIYMEIGSTQAIKAAVEAGLGIAILSKMAVLREFELNVIKEVKIKDMSLKRELWLVLAPQRFRRQGVDKLLRFFKTVRLK